MKSEGRSEFPRPGTNARKPKFGLRTSGFFRISDFGLRVSLTLLLASAIPGRAADRFGDITVAPQVMHMAETQHGYHEFRVHLENHSSKAGHKVTLTYPAFPFPFGNSIRALGRTVSIGPNSRVVVPLWQPALPSQGNGMMRIAVDGREVGSVTIPNANRHATRPHFVSGQEEIRPALLVSRSLNQDEILKGVHGSAYSPAMAIGPPDASAPSLDALPASWVPDPSSAGPQWLELDFDPPIPIEQVRIFETGNRSPRKQEIVLLDAAAGELLRVNKPSVPRTGRGSSVDITFPLTTEPVKTVRLEFLSTGAGNVAGVDAVQVAGPAGTRWAAAARASSSRRGGGAGADQILLRAELPVNDWSENWLSYTSYDGILLAEQDLSSMAPAVLSSLWRYAETGGDLYVFGKLEIPEPWRRSGTRSSRGVMQYDVGLGRCFVFQQQNLGLVTPAEMKLIASAAEARTRFWRSLPKDQKINAAFQVVPNAELPIRGIIFIMLGFIIVIGPANLIVLSRLKRRIWMLWTIPAISFLTCVAVFSYLTLREGVSPFVRLESVTVLDQVNRRATSFGLEAFYCPLTPSRGLTFSYETEVTSLVQLGDRRSGSAREIDWTEAQHLLRGWVEARVPAHFLVRKSETRRERLQWDGATGQPLVVNGLGAAIRTLRLADHSGRVFSGSNIAPGAQATLTLSSEPLLKGAPREPLHALFYRTALGGHSAALDTQGLSYLRPGAYLAELETSPFLENGLEAKSAQIQQRAWVYGILPPPLSP
jgi:hypothetical protein